ncbi:hypothetical protein HY626_02595 [Candidatus Uhrbacteria bacterium]|nr:hypothetical protein [Candidatus Uhrbacteria bacterium]
MPIIDAQDARDLDSHLQRFFDSTPIERPLRLRQLFNQKLDFNPATGKVSLAEAHQNVSLPPDADRIASIFLDTLPELRDIRQMGLEGTSLIRRLEALRLRYRLNPSTEDEVQETTMETEAVRIVCSEGI